MEQTLHTHDLANSSGYKSHSASMKVSHTSYIHYNEYMCVHPEQKNSNLIRFKNFAMGYAYLPNTFFSDVYKA
jgi:hypothetical protein